MPLTDKQQEYLRNCSHRWNVKTGATGSGKSYVDIAVTLPKRILACRGEGLIVLLGNTRGTIERNILEPMRELWPGLISHIRSDNTVMVFGKKCYALGADNKKHVARIQGSTIEYVYGDEVTTWSEDVFTMLKSRLRCKHSRFDGTCNPDNPGHWFKKFLDSGADIYQQSYVIDDGALEPEIVARLKREYAGTVYYNRYILGQWTAAEGIVYRQFADCPERFIVDNPPPVQLATIGVDFGGNGSAHAFVCTGITPGWREVVTLEEHYRKEVISPAALEADFVDFVWRCRAAYPVYEVYCDSAETTLIRGLQNAAARERLGVEVCAARKGPVNDRIRFYCAMMGAGRYAVSRRCTHVIEALSSALWSDKHPTKDVRLDDGTTDIDSLDAMEYSVEPYMEQLMFTGR